jgi:hypothetical protein
MLGSSATSRQKLSEQSENTGSLFHTMRLPMAAADFQDEPGLAGRGARLLFRPFRCVRRRRRGSLRAGARCAALGGALLLIVSLEAAPAGATEPTTADADIKTIVEQQQQMIEEQARRLEEQAQILARQQEILRQQQLQLEALERQATAATQPATTQVPYVDNGDSWYTLTQDVVPVPPDTGEPQPVAPTEGEPAAPSETPPADGTAPPANEAPVEGAPPPDGTTAAEEQRPESEKPTDQLLLERGGVLLRAGTLQIEPSVEYTHVSSNEVAISGFTIFDAIIIGNIEVDDLKRDIFTGAIAARYGITNRLQVDGRVPFLYRQDSEIFGVGTNTQQEFTSSGYGLGDVEFTTSYQPLIGDGGAIPDTIVRAHVRFPTGKDPFGIDTENLGNNRTVLEEPPTGSGFYGVGGGATFVWRVDPVVFFGGIDATFNIARSFAQVGEIDPGDTYQVFGGVNVQLSELVSLNLSFVEQYTTESTQEGQTIVGSDLNDARLVLGTAVGVGSNTSLTFNASAGLTNESPDFQFTIALPITFSLF